MPALHYDCSTPVYSSTPALLYACTSLLYSCYLLHACTPVHFYSTTPRVNSIKKLQAYFFAIVECACEFRLEKIWTQQNTIYWIQVCVNFWKQGADL